MARSELADNSTVMGARRGGAREHLPPSLEFEKYDAICCAPAKTLKFSLAPSALTIYNLEIGLKRREKTQTFSLAHSARGKMVGFLNIFM